jgi:hypothetical protein
MSNNGNKGKKEITTHPLDRYPPLPFARVKGVDDIGSSDDNNKKVIAQLRNELRNMQSECNRLIKEHDIAIKDLISKHKTAIATLTRKHEAAIKDYKRMAESNTNLITSIDETCPIEQWQNTTINQEYNKCKGSGGGGIK